MPCLVRQVHESVAITTDDDSLQEEILREALRIVADIRMDLSPPHMATVIHRMIRKRTGCSDPYREIKRRSNQAAEALFPSIRETVRSSQNPFEMAVRIGMAGNSIDFGVPSQPKDSELPEIIKNALSCKIFGEQPKKLQAAIENADSILILGDNAGEIVFDRLLLEELPLDRCTYVVRGAPILNDVTLEDAREVGLTEMLEVIDNGADVPGTVLEFCSNEFVKRFDEAELIIAKGQGNYETLSEVARGNLFFLFKAKCPVIARHIGCSINDYVIQFTSRCSCDTK